MSLFVIPRRLSLRLEKLQRDFLLVGRRAPKKASFSGSFLGIRKLSTLNKDLLGKWSWGFAYENEALWNLVIVGKYQEEEAGWCS